MKYRILFWLILFIGVFLRLYHALTAPFAYANSDTCTVWLMARHILQGEFPLFFYSQYYLGPMEALTIAFFWLIFGVKISTLYLGNIFYSALFIVSGYFLGKEIRDRSTGLLVMLFSALPSVYFFSDSISPLGYHIEILLLGNIIFILTLKAVERERKTLLFILIGLCAGLGIWAHYIIVYYLFPAFLYLIINEKWKVLLKNAVPVLVSFFLIGLPFWIFTFRYNFATFKLKHQASPPQEIMKFFMLMLKHIAQMFDIRATYASLSGILSLAVVAIYAISLAFFLCQAIFRKKFFFNKDSIVVYFFVFLIILYVGYRTKMYSGEGLNYILPILTLIGIAFGCFGGFLLKKNKVIGLGIISIVISFNTINILKAVEQRKEVSNSYRNIIYDRIKFLEENKILCFAGHEGYSRVPVFFSREKITATAYMDGGYRRYEDIVDASERVAYEECSNDWRPALNNVCLSYDCKNGLFFNFKPYPYKIKVILPDKWHAWAGGRIAPKYAFDRNSDTFWSTGKPKKTGQGFTINLGRIHRICGIEYLNPRRYQNYPNGCRIQVSIDGIVWKDAAFIEKVEPIFWSGPRVYWRLIDGRIEWVFRPVRARFVKLIQVGEDRNNPWEINEIFIYEYAGRKGHKIRDYIKEAKEIAVFLKGKGIGFLYADFWLSAKVRSITEEKIMALEPYNSYLPLRKNMSREVQLEQKRAFAVAKEDTKELEKILKEFELPFEKRCFKNYTCYYMPGLDNRYESIKSLFWIGIGLVKHSLKDYSRWLCDNGDYIMALEYYPNNFYAYVKSGSEGIPRTKFFPLVEKDIRFKNGIKFIGYSVRSRKARPGKMIRIEYFWKLKKEPDSNLSVFVHFRKDGKIFFQNDHAFLYQFPRPLVPLRKERFRESLKFVIPEEIDSGVYNIVIGLWDAKKQKRVRIEGPPFEKSDKQLIGELIVYNPIKKGTISPRIIIKEEEKNKRTIHRIIRS